MNPLAKTFLKILVWPSGIALVLGIYFADNIKGYYRFKEICTREAGLKVYQSLERDVGWVSDKNESSYLLRFYKSISFVRYVDATQSFQDLMRTAEKRDFSDDGFRAQPADLSKQPLYLFNKTIEAVPHEYLLTRFRTTVTNLHSGQVAVTYQNLLFQIFNVDWGPGQGTSCTLLRYPDSKKNPRYVEEEEMQQAFSSK